MKKVGGRFASYQGTLYKAESMTDPGRIQLVAYLEPPPELGFDAVRPGLWRKRLGRPEVTEYYLVRVDCTYRGLDCGVIGEDGDRLRITYLSGYDDAAAQAGLEQVDRGVWEGWVDRDQVQDLREVRTPL